MTSQFFHHAQTEDRFLSCVMEDMQAYQTGVEFSMLTENICLGICPRIESS